MPRALTNNSDPMKSSIKVSRGGRSITFRGGAARSVFESMTGTKLPNPEEVKLPKQLPPRAQMAAELAELRKPIA